MANIETIILTARRAFDSGKTKRLSFRKKQLHQLLRCIRENENAFCEALKKDLHRPKFEAVTAELMMVNNEIVKTLEHLDEWAKDESCSKSLLQMFSKLYIRKEPYGVCLVMSAWNYPIALLLSPLVGAIAAGNCAIIKPSECAIHSAAILQELLPKYLDNECYPTVVLDSHQSAELTKNNRFDLIFFTGGTTVGRYVMRAAAEYLTPVILELGGKNPCYVDSSFDLRVAARRIVWGRYYNAGQVCLSPDYILISSNQRDTFVSEVKCAIKEFYGEEPKTSENYGRIINNRQFMRLKQLLECGSGQIVAGGNTDKTDNYIAPTVVVDVDIDSPFMTEEMFGPVMLIITISNLDEALSIINKQEKPLCLYMFSSDQAVVDKIICNTSSGGVGINDVFGHYISHDLPFGGIGNSGMGSYHGKYSFDAFSHKRSCFADKTPEAALDIRYPPYSDGKLSLARIVLQSNPKGVLSSKAFKFVLLSAFGVLLSCLYKYLMI